jgi:type I restriction enzyme S subunit
MSAAKTKHAPPLRFPEFTEPWKTNSIDSYVKRYNKPVTVEPDRMYRQIGVRSHGKGIFHKEPVTGKSLGDKRVFWVHPHAFVVNIVFGWEQAVALTSTAEDGFIASHRFPMFVPVENRTDLNFLLLANTCWD